MTTRDEPKPTTKKVNGSHKTPKTEITVTRDETASNEGEEEVSKEDVFALLRKTRIQAQDNVKKTRMAFKTLDPSPSTMRLKRKA